MGTTNLSVRGMDMDASFKNYLIAVSGGDSRKGVYYE